jgi:histidine triad (HIT) family protein
MPYDPDCVFCDILRHDINEQIELAFDDSVVITPINPVVPGHKLLIPDTHVCDIADNPSVTANVMGDVSFYMRHMEWGDCNVITSRGASATQTIFHMHIHLIPRAEGDGLLLPWSKHERAS